MLWILFSYFTSSAKSFRLKFGQQSLLHEGSRANNRENNFSVTLIAKHIAKHVKAELIDESRCGALDY